MQISSLGQGLSIDVSISFLDAQMPEKWHFLTFFLNFLKILKNKSKSFINTGPDAGQDLSNATFLLSLRLKMTEKSLTDNQSINQAINQDL